MAVARYWRLIGIEPQGGGDLALSEIALYDGMTRVDGSATLTSTFAPVSGSLTNLKDGDTGTSAAFAATDLLKPNFSLTWDFGAAQSVTDIKFGSVTAATFIGRCSLALSSDGVNWTVDEWVRGMSYQGDSLLQGTRSTDTLFDSVAVFYTFVTDNRLNESRPLISYTGGQSWANGELFAFAGADMAIPHPALPGDFTIEVRIRAANNATRDYLVMGGSGYRISGLSNGSGFGVWPQIKNNVGTVLIQGAASYAAEGTHNLAWTRSGSTNYLFIDGTLVGSFTDTTSHPAGSMSSGTNSSNYYSRLRVTVGTARYTATYTPVSLLTSGYAAPPVPARQSSAALGISAYTPPSTTTLRPAQSTLPLDVQDGGTTTVVGTVAKLDTPTNTPLRRRVRLYHSRGRRFIRETWSDATTGAFAFTGLKAGEEFNAVAYDHLGQYRAVAIEHIFGE